MAPSPIPLPLRRGLSATSRPCPRVHPVPQASPAPCRKGCAMLNGPLLVTERLILRPPAAEDFDAFAEMCAEPETMTYLGGACPRAQAWRHWSTIAGAWHIRGFSMFSVIERDTGEWVGRLGPWQPDGWPGPERSEERRGGKERVRTGRVRGAAGH